MKWGLVCKSKNQKSISISKEVYDFLINTGEVFIEKTFAERINLKGYSLKTINNKADIVVTIGGDGTIIRTLSCIEKPIFSINSGGMGFLSEVESKHAKEGLQQVINGEYNIEERAKLKIILDHKRLPDAANEVTVQTAKISKIMYLQLFVDGELLETLGADGIIISTPTGSTSYSLSVGGPLMDPSVNAMIVAPLAPFRLSARPWIVPLNKTVEVRILPKSKETKLVIDGYYSDDVNTKSKILVTSSEKKARFVRFGESFYQMVRLKLVR